jgi:hypothetical protein
MPASIVLSALLILGFASGAGDEGCQGIAAPDWLEAPLADPRVPVVLVFFSTDCLVCYEGLLDMIYFVGRNNLAVRVVGVSGDPAEDLRVFTEKYSVRVPVVHDERGRLRRRFDVDILPSRVVLRGGKILYRDDPYRGFDERREAVDSFLAGFAPSLSRKGPKDEIRRFR